MEIFMPFQVAFEEKRPSKSFNVPSASKEMVVITDFSLTFVAFRFAEKGRER
jgi:hypothetical protein